MPLWYSCIPTMCIFVNLYIYVCVCLTSSCLHVWVRLCILRWKSLGSSDPLLFRDSARPSRLVFLHSIIISSVWLLCAPRQTDRPVNRETDRWKSQTLHLQNVHLKTWYDILPPLYHVYLALWSGSRPIKSSSDHDYTIDKLLTKRFHGSTWFLGTKTWPRTRLRSGPVLLSFGSGPWVNMFNTWVDPSRLLIRSCGPSQSTQVLRQRSPGTKEAFFTNVRDKLKETLLVHWWSIMQLPKSGSVLYWVHNFGLVKT